jgi:hypothetical protein
MIAESCPQAIVPGAREVPRFVHAEVMSRKSTARKKARRRDGQTELPVSRMRGPGDVAVMIPYLLGFQPVESLVLVALEGPRKRFGPVLRVDLVDSPDLRREQVDRVVGVMATNGVGLVVVAAFSTEPSRADPLVRQVMDGLADEGIAVEDAFRADGRRWWSYVCHNPRCCGPDGTPYNAGAARVAAEAVMAGMAFEPDRDALRSQLAPDDPDARSRVASAVAALRAARKVRPWMAVGTVETAVASALGLAEPSSLSPVDTAWLALAVQTPDGAARAMAIVERDDAAEHYELWRVVTRRVADDLLPPVACLAGFAAWLDGRGVLASHAVDRVFDVAPGHPFALVIAELLDHGVNPRTWPEIRARKREDGSFPPPAA